MESMQLALLKQMKKNILAIPIVDGGAVDNNRGGHGITDLALFAFSPLEYFVL